MDKPQLTMGMPVYNEEKYIAQAIESLLAQTFKSFVLIISDNNSTDRTGLICQEYAKKDNRIVYIKHNENKGSMFNFRYVLEQANTPYFMWCGGHDKWHPCFVEKLLPAVEEGDTVLSYCKAQIINLDGSVGEILEDDNLTTIELNSPVGRYSHLLRKINNPFANLFHGIWRTEALKACEFDFKTIFFDVLISEQASFEGKFEKNNEALFSLRTVRDKETRSHGIKRQSADVTGKKLAMNTNINIFKIIYLFESIKIIFRKKYSLPAVLKIWLAMNVIYFKSKNLFVKPIIGALLKFFLPERIYLQFKTFLKARILRDK